MSVHQGNSNEVSSNQIGVHENLEDYLKKYSFDSYARPCAEFSKYCWNQIVEFIGSESVIFDLGCGVGESSFKLAQTNSKIKVVGIDRSISRLDRNNSFKRDIPSNLLLIRGELLDLIPLIYTHQSSLRIHSIYFLYPNPYPKKHHIKKRFQGNPVAIFIFNISCPIIFRSNWKLYLEEAQFTANFYNRKSELKVLEEIEEPFTPFERKFIHSGQKVFELLIH